LRELQQNVIQREHIRRLRGPASGGQQKTGGGGRVEDGGKQPWRETGRNPPLPRRQEDEGAAKAARAAFKEVRSGSKTDSLGMPNVFPSGFWRFRYINYHQLLTFIGNTERSMRSCVVARD